MKSLKGGHCLGVIGNEALDRVDSVGDRGDIAL